jgi:hypothetical protein
LTEQNPILTGQLITYDIVKFNVFYDFVDYVTLDNNKVDFKLLSKPDKLDFLKTIVEPNVVNLGSGFDQFKSQGPLFKVTVFDIGFENVCIAISMSHSIGDGCTYYNLIKQIDLLMADEEVEELNWGSSERFEYSWRPYYVGKMEELLTKICMFFCFAFKYFFGAKKRSHSLILSKAKLEHLKLELRGDEHEFLSSNDIITAALNEADHGVDLNMFVMNARGRIKGYDSKMAGNYEKTIPYDTQTCRDPNQIRTLVKNKRFFGDWEMFFWSYFIGRLGIITNWSSLTEFFTLDGLIVECHAPFSDFVTNTPCDLAVIYQFDRDTLAISHNYKNIDMAGIIEDILL